MTTTRKSTNRRAGRHVLTRERVLLEGRRLLEERGLEALSMRALAERLGVSNMALYNHVADKQDLIQGIARVVVRELRIPAAKGDWKRRLRAPFRALRKHCLANPRILPLLEMAEELDPAVFRPMEVALAGLEEAGIEGVDAMRAYFLLTNFTLGQLAYEIRGPFRGLDPVAATIRGLVPAEQFPLVVRAARAASTHDWDFDTAFEFGVDVIIGGLEARANGA